MKNEDNSQKNVILGQNIKDIRKGLNLTQEELSEKLGINPQFLSQVENGKVGISVDNAINICKIGNCSSVNLFLRILLNHLILPTNMNY